MRVKRADGSLASAINAATSQLHTDLNRLILKSLPRALPPHSCGSELYAYGMLPILAIYDAFESEFHSICKATCASNHNRSTQILNALKYLRQDKLERRHRLRRDLQSMSKDLDSSILNSEPLDVLLDRIRTALPARPHLFLAYFHLFYLALFNGGRHLRRALYSAGGDTHFWHISTQASPRSYFDNNNAQKDEMEIIQLPTPPASNPPTPPQTTGPHTTPVALDISEMSNDPAAVLTFWTFDTSDPSSTAHLQAGEEAFLPCHPGYTAYIAAEDQVKETFKSRWARLFDPDPAHALSGEGNRQGDHGVDLTRTEREEIVNEAMVAMQGLFDVVRARIEHSMGT